MSTGTTVMESSAALAIANVLVSARGRKSRPSWSSSVNTGSYGHVAREWGVGESAVRVAIHRLRRRVSTLLRGALCARRASFERGGKTAAASV